MLKKVEHLFVSDCSGFNEVRNDGETYGFLKRAKPGKNTLADKIKRFLARYNSRFGSFGARSW